MEDAGSDVSVDAGGDMDVSLDVSEVGPDDASDASDVGDADVNECPDRTCLPFKPDEVINCIPVPADIEQQFSVCRVNEQTGCKEFLIESCELGQVCVFPSPADGPCQAS